MESAFLSFLWWDRVVNAWNSGPYVRSLAGLGCVYFQVLDEDIQPVCIEWDASGYARRLQGHDGDGPCFSATIINWRRFVDGEFKAVLGVLQGRIRYQGDLLDIMPYAQAFDDFARIAHRVVMDVPVILTDSTHLIG